MSIRIWKLLERSTQRPPITSLGSSGLVCGQVLAVAQTQSLLSRILFTPGDSNPQLHTHQSTAALLSLSSPQVRDMAELSHPIFPTAKPATPKFHYLEKIRGS